MCGRLFGKGGLGELLTAWKPRRGWVARLRSLLDNLAQALESSPGRCTESSVPISSVYESSYSGVEARSLSTCGYSSVEFQPSSTKPNLALPFRLADKLCGKAYTGREMRVAVYLQNHIINNIVHSRRGRKKL